MTYPTYFLVSFLKIFNVGGLFVRRGSAYEGSTSRILTRGQIALFRRLCRATGLQYSLVQALIKGYERRHPRKANARMKPFTLHLI